MGLDEGLRGGHHEDTYGIAFRVAPAGTKVNIADILTKILTTFDFIRLRDMIMHKLPDTIE